MRRTFPTSSTILTALNIALTKVLKLKSLNLNHPRSLILVNYCSWSVSLPQKTIIKQAVLIASRTFRTLLPQKANLCSYCRSAVQSQAFSKLKQASKSCETKIYQRIWDNMSWERSELKETHFVSKCRRNSTCSLSAAYAVIVDWQLGVRMARPGSLYTGTPGGYFTNGWV